MRRCKYVLMLVVWMLAVVAGGTAQIISNGASGGGNPTGAAFPANAQTSTYQVLASDFAVCKSIPVASGTFTATLVASTSQPASGQCVWVINYGTGTVTVARNGQNINGVASNIFLLAPNGATPSWLLVISDGTNYFTTAGGTFVDAIKVGSSTQNWFIAGSNGASLAGGGYLSWSTAGTNAGFTLDVGLDRDGAGTLGLINGTAGTTAANYRDLKLRHTLASGTAPSITSGFGTSPTPTGADQSGKIVIGTGGTVSTGLIAFGAPYTTNAPFCTANNEGTVPLHLQTVVTTTGITINAFGLATGTATPFAAGEVVRFGCTGGF